MSTPTTPVPIETLLAHEAWVRTLAVHLTSDPSAADDLEQDTWVEALARPPAHAGNLRGWFARVTRSLARKDARSRKRVRRREHAAARPESVPATDELVGHAETQRDVVDAVLALDEPYRSTLLLSFYQGLPPRRVAEEMSVPVETVRTRTRRALARVRARLEDKYEKDWRAALLPLVAGIRVEETAMASTATVGAAAAAVVLGGLGLAYVAGAFGGSQPMEGDPGGDAVADVGPLRELPEDGERFADHDETDEAPAKDAATSPEELQRMLDERDRDQGGEAPKASPDERSGGTGGSAGGGTDERPDESEILDHEETPATVTFDVKQTTLDELVDLVATQTGAKIELRGDMVNNAATIPITLKLTNLTVERVLDTLARVSGGSYGYDEATDTHYIE